ncbi:helix-turn-helix transcriptional regulator [Glutamicibacter sp. MNS18]|uniref:winged helix-turn-helix transcriptional regulator n=1 Tax=Glutamicibacter sp. MNS18 TaxID=2989817 RepID=UPI0022364E02|nr:helix-turn-helix domain-containing protein [Glutamicibacter sp. MNS18]MCW4464275.1 helix-turn-helix transcriptional regulator [Glutamicibacter sp. MNS18]
MISTPRSGCPVNRALEVLGDRWTLIILRDIAAYGRRGFRELLNANDEGISAPVLSRRLTDLTEAGLLTKVESSRGKQGRYSLTELGIRTVPVMVELARFGAVFDPQAAGQLPSFLQQGGDFASRLDELRQEHLGEDAPASAG